MQAALDAAGDHVHSAADESTFALNRRESRGREEKRRRQGCRYELSRISVRKRVVHCSIRRILAGRHGGRGRTGPSVRAGRTPFSSPPDGRRVPTPAIQRPMAAAHSARIRTVHPRSARLTGSQLAPPQPSKGRSARSGHWPLLSDFRDA